jgi:hypothetical protein
LVFFAGCSGGSNNTSPVSGIVRFPDGKLLREGTIEFELASEENAATATGEIGPDGSFVLGTFAAADGAIPGKHRVAVICDVVIGNGAERPGMIAKTKLDPKFRDFGTSGLEFVVQKSSNNFIVEVTYAPVEQ